MSQHLFISYRRDDEPGMARALYGELERVFPETSLFMDVEGGIAPGQDFVRAIEDQVSRCQIMLAMIGKAWLNTVDADGRRRLDNPEDFVRIEIESAMRLGKLVIPVVLNRTEPPRAADLPESMKPFARLQAVRLTHERFKSDCQGIIRTIQAETAAGETSRRGAKRKLSSDTPQQRRARKD